MKRRSFLYMSGILSFSVFARPLSQMLYASNKIAAQDTIKKDPNNIIDVHNSLSYKIISKQGSKMSDGYSIPGQADGMGAFSIDGNTVLVRNHELGKLSGILMGPFNDPKEEVNRLGNKHYDPKAFGGTTNIVIDNASKKVVNEFLSLSGTMANCAGGISPWNTWLTCEENISKKRSDRVSHGYIFEVDPKKQNLQDPKPLKQMGRFYHEAVAFDKYGSAYLTEDRDNGLIYKFVPKNKNSLATGDLYALKINIKDSRNWKKTKAYKNKKYKIEWIRLEDVDPVNDTLRKEGIKKGATVFARGEGITHDGSSLFICCTSGGKLKKGQIWRLTPYTQKDSIIELWYEIDRQAEINMPDNLTVAPWGDLIVCEDNSDINRLWGINPNGKAYLIAENNYNRAELAGVCFAPNGNTLYLNIQQSGLTISIDGNWSDFRL